MAWFTFVRPLQSLAADWQLKSILTLLLSGAAYGLHNLMGLYTDLLALPTYLLVGASIAFMADFLTAVLSAYKRDGLAGIEMIKFRQLAIKGAYWVLIISVFSNLSSTADRAGFTWGQYIDEYMIVWLIVQDGWSALVNWKGKHLAIQWVEGALDLANGDLKLSDYTPTYNAEENGT